VKQSERVYPAQLRAEVVAVLLTGAGVSDTARRFGLTRQICSRWLKEFKSPRVERMSDLDPQLLEERIYQLVDQFSVTLVAQLEAAARPEWVARQTAAELAALVKEERDSLIRLLSGFRPVSDPRPSDGDAAPAGKLGAGEVGESS
jgi:transposase-like protein